MILGLIVYVWQRNRLTDAGDRVSQARGQKADATPPAPLTRQEWKRVAAIFVFSLFTILCWAAYEQKGASVNLFALKLVRTEIFGWHFPSSWLQSLTPLYVIMLAPIFSLLWVRLGDQQPSSPGNLPLASCSSDLPTCS